MTNPAGEYLGFPNYNEPKRVPGYLLVYRWAHCSSRQWTWQYVTKTFDSLEEALSALNPATANEITEHDFIGLWKLTDDALVPLISERTERIQRTIQERRTNKTLWSPS